MSLSRDVLRHSYPIPQKPAPEQDQRHVLIQMGEYTEAEWAAIPVVQRQPLLEAWLKKQRLEDEKEYAEQIAEARASLQQEWVATPPALAVEPALPLEIIAGNRWDSNHFRAIVDIKYKDRQGYTKLRTIGCVLGKESAWQIATSRGSDWEVKPNYPAMSRYDAIMQVYERWLATPEGKAHTAKLGF
jgi:hypothetical protein